MEKLVGYRLRDGKGVRKECGCMETVDIGDYNCCGHECLYCYANYNDKTITQRIKLHDPYSSVLIGHIEDTDRITIRKDKNSSVEASLSSILFFLLHTVRRKEEIYGRFYK